MLVCCQDVLFREAKLEDKCCPPPAYNKKGTEWTARAGRENEERGENRTGKSGWLVLSFLFLGDFISEAGATAQLRQCKLCPEDLHRQCEVTVVVSAAPVLNLEKTIERAAVEDCELFDGFCVRRRAGHVSFLEKNFTHSKDHQWALAPDQKWEKGGGLVISFLPLPSHPRK